MFTLSWETNFVDLMTENMWIQIHNNTGLKEVEKMAAFLMEYFARMVSLSLLGIAVTY